MLLAGQAGAGQTAALAAFNPRGENMAVTPRGFWLAGLPGTVSFRDLDAYLAQGVWTSPNPSGQVGQLATVQPGDLIALKSTRNRTTDLPFFNADHPASAMAIIATGEVVSVDPQAGTVHVTWNHAQPDREWYFFTYVKGLVRVEPSDARRLELFNSLFNEGPQDLQRYLDNPFWSHRFAAAPGLSWIAFYEAFATRLKEFRHKRDDLVAVFRDVATTEPLLSYLVQDKPSDGEVAPIEDLDPFTAMGAFNRGITEANRIRIAGLLGERLGVTAPPPTDFDAVPILNNLKSWFVRYSAARGPDDIDLLWDVFDAGLDVADHDSSDARARFAAAYDSAQTVNGVHWNLSIGLFWARPATFVPLDDRTRAYLARHYSLGEPTSGAEYLELLDALRDRFTSGTTTITSPALLSYAAFCFAPYNVPHTVDGFATWGMRLSEVIDLDDTEHDYKRTTATLLAATRDAAARRDDAWIDKFKRALRSTNTLGFRFVDDLVKASQRDPDATLAALNTVWDDPQVESLDRLKAALVDLLGKVTPGNATALSAALLMSVDCEANAPYSPSRTTRWYSLTGFDASMTQDSPSQRYATMLRFLDEVRAAVNDVAGQTLSRLEAQGVAWAITDHPTPRGWPADEQTALRAWRGSTVGAWLIRAGDETVARWLDQGSVSVESAHLPPVDSETSDKQIRAAVEAGYSGADTDRVDELAIDAHTFLTAVAPGDYVLTQSGADLVLGVVDGAPEYDDTSPAGVDRLRCSASWVGVLPPSALDASLSTYLDLPGRLLSLSQESEALGKLLGGPLDPVPATDDEVVTTPPVLPPGGVPWLPDATDGLAARLHIDRAELQELIDLMQARQQVVFYGPPGTGKTYLAKELARHIVGSDRSRARLVQFHPSYAYEDFFEGFRPTETAAGQASFRLTSGPLRRIAAAAATSPEYPHVLVIDELNRANLAKVFGELYFLLEYRNESINVQYRPTEAFRLPPNLFFIGTMNTADRSIALLDAAMRRRFSFIELHPDEAPVSGVLAGWLAANRFDDDRAHLLAALNAAIEDQDRDLRIGPSYLMRPEAGTEEGLARVWKHDIMPLLEEHYYGRLSRDQLRDRFGLAALRAGVRGDTDDADESDDVTLGDGVSAALGGGQTAGPRESEPAGLDPDAAGGPDN